MMSLPSFSAIDKFLEAILKADNSSIDMYVVAPQQFQSGSSGISISRYLKTARSDFSYDFPVPFNEQPG